MSTSTVEHAGHTYTFKGRTMTHAVITTVAPNSSRSPLYSRAVATFAGSLDKARKIASATESRTADAKAGRPLRGLYDSEWHSRVIETVIVATTLS